MFFSVLSQFAFIGGIRYGTVFTFSLVLDVQSFDGVMGARGGRVAGKVGFAADDGSSKDHLVLGTHTTIAHVKGKGK